VFLSARAVLFANGELNQPQALHRLLLPEDFLVAVDGGLYAMRRMGLQPHLLVGDLDSVDSLDVLALEQAGCEVRRFPVEKDETDLELALQIVAARGYKNLRILAALGGRLDQMLGNLFLLTHPAWQDLDVRLVDAGLEVFIIRRQAVIQGLPGDTVSLIPFNGPAYGVSTENLAYPLEDETLCPDRTRGVSNRMLAPQARVGLQQGVLLCVHLLSDFETPLSQPGQGIGEKG
jgi:thiamine pyrophosphokinase